MRCARPCVPNIKARDRDDAGALCAHCVTGSPRQRPAFPLRSSCFYGSLFPYRLIIMHPLRAILQSKLALRVSTSMPVCCEFQKCVITFSVAAKRWSGRQISYSNPSKGKPGTHDDHEEKNIGNNDNASRSQRISLAAANLVQLCKSTRCAVSLISLPIMSSRSAHPWGHS